MALYKQPPSILWLISLAGLTGGMSGFNSINQFTIGLLEISSVNCQCILTFKSKQHQISLDKNANLHDFIVSGKE